MYSEVMQNGLKDKWVEFREQLDALGYLIGAVLVVGAIIWGIYSLFGWGEREGVVKFDDCRQMVTLKPDTLQKYFKSFTCMYRRTESERIMSGECVHVDTAGTLFSSSNECDIAYIYEKEQEGSCTDPKYPYLGYDDMCHTNLQ